MTSLSNACLAISYHSSQFPTIANAPPQHPLPGHRASRTPATIKTPDNHEPSPSPSIPFLAVERTERRRDHQDPPRPGAVAISCPSRSPRTPQHPSRRHRPDVDAIASLPDIDLQDDEGPEDHSAPAHYINREYIIRLSFHLITTAFFIGLDRETVLNHQNTFQMVHHLYAILTQKPHNSSHQSLEFI
jgi:hypothetical protein